MRLRAFFYSLARLLGDFSSIKSGNPNKIVKRAKNKIVGRSIGKRLYRR